MSGNTGPCGSYGVSLTKLSPRDEGELCSFGACHPTTGSLSHRPGVSFENSKLFFVLFLFGWLISIFRIIFKYELTFESVSICVFDLIFMFSQYENSACYFTSPEDHVQLTGRKGTCGGYEIVRCSGNPP